MKGLRNQDGSVLVFVTLMSVLLLIIVGMGLDTGQLAYTRSTSQTAVDAAALAAAAAIPTQVVNDVITRAMAFNTTNTFTDSTENSIKAASVTLMNYDPTKNPPLEMVGSIGFANAVRVALEAKNPYDPLATNTPIKSPLFLTPLFNLLGTTSRKTQDVSVSAVAVNYALASLPIAVEESMCGRSTLLHSTSSGTAFDDRSGYTTYWVNSANLETIRDFLGAANNCSGGIAAFTGTQSCANMSNQVIAETYNYFENLFLDKKNQGKCFLIPVVDNGANWQACNPIKYFGSWCPDTPDTKDSTKKPVTQTSDEKYLSGKLTCSVDPTPTNVDSTNLKCFTQVLVRDKKSGM